MRVLVVLVLGLVVGALAASYATNILRMRDAYPRGVMAVMQHHLGAMRNQARQPACRADASLDALRRLRTTSDEILPAFDDGPARDAPFRKAVTDLQQTLDDAIARPPARCAALTPLVRRIANRCDSCHRDYR